MKRYRYLLILILISIGYLVYRFSANEPTQSPPDPVLLPVDTASLYRIEIRSCGERAFHLLRESDRWYISDRGIHQPADAREVELFLAALADLRVYGLLPGERYEEEDYLPEQGTATRIAIGGSGQSARTLWISCNPEPSDTALARLNPEAEVFQISGRRALVLNRPAGTYRLSWRLDLSRIPEKCEEFRFQKGDSSLLSSRPDTLAQWLRKLEGMPLGRPVPSPESMPVVWQMECLEGTGELTWMVLFKDSLRRTYLLESSQAPNLYFPLDSALATPPFLPVDGGR